MAASGRAAQVEVLWDGIRGDPDATAWRALDATGGEAPASWTFRGADVTWNYEPGIGVWSSPALARIGDRVVCFVGSYDRNVYALDALTGKEIWRYPTGNGVFATPAVVRIDGRECVLAASTDRTLYCIDARTGMKVWAYEVYEWKQSLGRAFLGSPIVIIGRDGPSIIQVSWVFDTAPKRKTEIAEVRAITPEGHLRWKRQFAESHPTHPAWAEIDGQARLYIGCRDGNLYCLDANGGDEIWRQTMKFPIDAAPVIVSSKDRQALVLAGAKFGYLKAFEAASGRPVWSFKAGHSIDGTPAIVRAKDGRDLAVVGSYDGRLYCLDARTGSEVWRYATRGSVVASAAVVPRDDGFEAFVPSDDDMLHAVEGARGRGIWRMSPGPFLWAYRGLGDTIWASPAAARIGGVEMLIVPHYDGRVHAYRLDKSAEWLPETGDPAYGRAMLGRIGASMLATLLAAMIFSHKRHKNHKKT